MYHSHCFEKVVSITMEVGNSEDGFWPKPSRIAPIAEQSWWPAYYLLHAAGEQLQLQWISLTPDPKKSNAVLLTATVQNNGLAKLSGDVAGCAKATSASGKTTTRLEPGEGWSTNRRLSSCANLPALDSRAAAALPTLRIEWDAADAWAEVLFALEPTKGPKLASDVTVRIATDARTLTSCDELCLCPQTDERELSYSDACRQRIKAGSNCKVALPAKMGSNSASGVDDEFFVFTPSTGGSCRVGTTHRDTLLAVYGACGRVGAQQPVAFSNSEGHKADVEFACTAGKKYYVFWNAEYQPRAFSYTISEHGGKDSRSRMKGRRTDMWLHKLRGSRRGARR